MRAEAAAASRGGQAGAGGGGHRPRRRASTSRKLDEFGKKVFFRIANSESSVCGQAQSLMQSVKSGACRRSVNALRYVAKLIEAGFTDSEIAEKLANALPPGQRQEDRRRRGADEGEPVAPRSRWSSSPTTSARTAGGFQPVLHQILDEFRSDVKLYFKHYPLPQHTNARLAAEAAVAAQKQGKFWQFQDKLWEKSDELTPAEIEKAAKEVGLDVTKFRQDMASEAVKARVQKDRSDGAAAGLQATPTLYINGREYTDGRDSESLREWIKDQIGRQVTLSRAIALVASDVRRRVRDGRGRWRAAAAARPATRSARRCRRSRSTR